MGYNRCFILFDWIVSIDYKNKWRQSYFRLPPFVLFVHESFHSLLVDGKFPDPTDLFLLFLPFLILSLLLRCHVILNVVPLDLIQLTPCQNIRAGHPILQLVTHWRISISPRNLLRIIKKRLVLVHLPSDLYPLALWGIQQEHNILQKITFLSLVTDQSFHT